ncbi:MAG: ABC transporter permease [Alphaproteobacteria bacterium]|nr:ABC transporter permease [Alphaproteobacteria bacterium]
MLGYVAVRLLSAIPVLGIVAVFVFFLLTMIPGDPAQVIAGDFASPEQVQQIRAALQLDRPLAERFVAWALRLASGDFGKSLFSGIPVAQLVGQRIEPTLMLATMTVCIAVAIAVPLGLVAAYKPGGWVARVSMTTAVLGFSLPVFIVAYLLVYPFALGLRWFPVQGYVPLSQGLWVCLHSLTLPALALSLLYIALIARVTRAAVLEVLREDYVRTAHAKGLAERRVLVRHVLRNAAVPVVTVVGIGFAALLGGVVVTETIFSIPGLGRLTADSILRRDYPVVQALILLFSTVYVVVNLGVDLIYAAIDPRIRY